MAVAFKRNQILTRGDLDIFLTNSSGNVANASSISYALYFVDPGPPETDVLIGDPQRIPENPSIGEYYASVRIPTTATYGRYRIRWTLKEFVNSNAQTVVQEFEVVPENSVLGPEMSNGEKQMVYKLRMLLRDQCLAGEELVTVDADGEKITLPIEELYELIGETQETQKIKDAFQKGKLTIKSMGSQGEFSWKQISKAHKNPTPVEPIYKITTEQGKQLIVTGGHRVYMSPNLCVPAEELSVGLSLQTSQGTTKISHIEVIENRPFMFDLTVEENHNLVLEGSDVVVHNCPDKFYHFRPPEHESNIGSYNQVFGQVWEDAEFLEYLERALDWWNLQPPETENLSNMDQLISQKPAWRTPILQGAIQFAAMALQANWIVDEFSVRGDTDLEVLLPSGEKVKLTIEELHEIIKEEGEE
jgi:hypothetical protein